MARQDSQRTRSCWLFIRRVCRMDVAPVMTYWDSGIRYPEPTSSTRRAGQPYRINRPQDKIGGMGGLNSTGLLTKRQFRLLVVAPTFVGIVGIVATVTGESRLPEPLQAYLQEQQNAGIGLPEAILAVIGLATVVVGIGSFVGMLLLTRWSRPLAIGATAISLVLLPLSGPTVDHGLATALYYTSGVLWGGLMAVAYSSWADPLFRQPKAGAKRS